MKIRFLSQSDAEKLIPNKDSAIISIVGLDSPPRKLKGWTNRLDLYFDDVVIPTLRMKLFNSTDANKIKKFVKTLPRNINIIYVHCHHGQSRSVAIAKWLNEYYKTGDFPLFNMSFNPLVYHTLKKVS